MLFDDYVVTDREAEAGALASGLRSEKRIEDLLLHLGRDAGAVVPDRYFDPVTEVLGAGSKGRLVVASICFRFALRRRIEAVGNQIEQNPPVTESLTVNSIEKSAVQSS
jgi:hypothetical protein